MEPIRALGTTDVQIGLATNVTAAIEVTVAKKSIALGSLEK